MKLKSLLQKKIIVLLVLLSFNKPVSAQTIVINLVDKGNNISISSDRKTINRVDSHNIIVKGLNTAKYKITVEPKFTKKKSEIPGILSPLLPNVKQIEDNAKNDFKLPNILFMNLETKSFNIAPFKLDETDTVKKIIKTKEPINELEKTKNKENAKESVDNTATVTDTLEKKKKTLDPSFKLVLGNIDKSNLTLKELKKDYDTLYTMLDSASIAKEARRILLKAKNDDEAKKNLKIYDQKIRDAMNAFNANVSILEALVSKFSLDQFTDTFIVEYTKTKAASQFISENKDVFLKMAEFIGKASTSKQRSEFPKASINGDFTAIEVKIVRTNEDFTTETFIVDQKFNNRNYVKWLNITGGFFGNNLVNPDFAISSDKSTIIKEERIKFDISIGAMANVNYVWRPEFKTGLGFGVALSPFDGKTRYMLGGTLTFGVRNEFALSGGIMWAKLQALSSSISTDGSTYDKSLMPTVTTNTVVKSTTTQSTGTTSQTTEVSNNTLQNTFSSGIPTYNKWYTGFFIGITYSFLKR